MSIFGKDEEETMENRKIQENDVDALIVLLDGRTQAGDSRIKLDIVEGQGEVVARPVSYTHLTLPTILLV